MLLVRTAHHSKITCVKSMSFKLHYKFNRKVGSAICEAIDTNLHQQCTTFQKSTSHLKILRTTRVTTFHVHNLLIFGTTIQNVFSWTNWHHDLCTPDLHRNITSEGSYQINWHEREHHPHNEREERMAESQTSHTDSFTGPKTAATAPHIQNAVNTVIAGASIL